MTVSYSSAFNLFIGFLIGLVVWFLYGKKLRYWLNKTVRYRVGQLIIFLIGTNIVFLFTIFTFFLLAIWFFTFERVQYYGIDKAYENQIVREYEAVIIPLNSSLNDFKLVERIHLSLFALHHAALQLGLRGINNENNSLLVQEYSNKIKSRNRGVLLKELIFEPLKANNNSYAKVQLSQDISYTIQSLCEALPENTTCTYQGYDYCCPIASIKLLKFPKGLFYAAHDKENLAINDYLEHQTIKWSNKQYFDYDGIKFAYISPQFYQVKDLIKILLNLSSVDRWIFVILGILSSIPVVSTLKRKPSIKKQVIISGNSYHDRSNTMIQKGSFGIGNVHSSNVNAKTIAGTINEDQSRELLDIAKEIKLILEELSQDYPTKTTDEKMIVVTEAVNRIEENSILKNRVINALRAGGVETLKEAVNHPLINILMAIVEGWKD